MFFSLESLKITKSDIWKSIWEVLLPKNNYGLSRITHKQGLNQYKLDSFKTFITSIISIKILLISLFYWFYIIIYVSLFPACWFTDPKFGRRIISKCMRIEKLWKNLTYQFSTSLFVMRAQFKITPDKYRATC